MSGEVDAAGLQYAGLVAGCDSDFEAALAALKYSIVASLLEGVQWLRSLAVSLGMFRAMRDTAWCTIASWH